MARPSRQVVQAGAVLVVAALGVAAVVLPGRVEDAAARAAAERYVGLVASGDEADQQELWAMAVDESPGARRTAGELVVAAEERIQVVSVGSPHGTPEPDLPHGSELDDVVGVEVDYRLAGREHRSEVVLGRVADRRGFAVGDWRVVVPLSGSIGWDEPGFADLVSDVYVGDVRQVRRARVLGTSDDDVQPLFPAVYAVQSRLDPWFATQRESLTVLAGEPTPAPDLQQAPTAATEERVAADVADRFAACGEPGAGFSTCPALDVADRAGIDTYGGGWWLGLVEEPTTTITGNAVEVRGGSLAIRTPRGRRVVSADATGRLLLDNQSWTPVLLDLTLDADADADPEGERR